MTTQQELLAAVISNPDVDIPRLMYADYLQDSDNKLDRLLGQYIKLSIDLSTHKKLIKPRVDVAAKSATFVGDGYRGVDSYQWYRRGIELDKEVARLYKVDIQYHPYHFRLYHFKLYHGDVFGFELDRGFISSVICTANQFLSICDKLIWHESMVDKTELPDPASGRTTGEWYREESRPCPLTAHPVRKVKITNAHMTLPSTGSRLVLSKIADWVKLAPQYGIEILVIDE